MNPSRFDWSKSEFFLSSAAIEYCCGQQTRMASIGADFLVRNAAAFAKHEREWFIKFLETRIVDGHAGADMDVREWQAALDSLRKAGE